MQKPCLNTANNLLEILEFSLLHSPTSEGNKLPMKGMLEIIGQVRSIISTHVSTSNSPRETLPNEMFDDSAFAFNGKSLNLELEVDKTSSSASAVTNSAVNYRPKVRTVPPEVRGRIRELVGMESEESF